MYSKNMYPNLRAEMARKKITSTELANKLNISTSTMSTKMNGKYDFTLEEAKEIQHILNTDIPIDVLFKKE